MKRLKGLCVSIVCTVFLANSILYPAIGTAGDYLAAQSKLGEIFAGAQEIYTLDEGVRDLVLSGIKEELRLSGDYILLKMGKEGPYYVISEDNVYRFQKSSRQDEKDGVTEALAGFIRNSKLLPPMSIRGESYTGEQLILEPAVRNALREGILRRRDTNIKTKGEGVHQEQLVTEISNFTKRQPTVPEKRFITDAMNYVKDKRPELAGLIDRLLAENKIEILTGDTPPLYVYLSMRRRMRYNVIASIDDVIYIPEGLLGAFMSGRQLEQYIGEEHFNRLKGDKTDIRKWLVEVFAGGLAHEIYEVDKWINAADRRNFNKKNVHPAANAVEKDVCGNSIFDDESAFDDIAKLLILKSAGMKLNIPLFDVLRDRQRDSQNIEKYPFGFEKHKLRGNLRDKLQVLFAGRRQTTDAYYLITFYGAAIALSRVRADGTEEVYEIYREDTPDSTGIYTYQRMADDYKYLAERQKKHIEDRYVLTYDELERYEKNEKKGFGLSGGKGLSLSLMAGVVPVPAGVVISTSAYFKFISDNPELKNYIAEKLGSLDTMDDATRQTVAGDIQERILKAEMPADVEEEILLMYRQLNIIAERKGRDTPVPVAIRSSGTKEDINVKSWLSITTGAQAGQSDTFLNVRGQDEVINSVKRDWASLFTDRAVSYRDDAAFIMFSSALGNTETEQRRKFFSLREILGRYGYSAIADVMEGLRNPGSYNVLSAIRNILREKRSELTEDEIKLLEESAAILEKIRKEFVNPLEIGIAVVMMHMVKSYLSGVGFTVNPASSYGGKQWGLRKAWAGTDKAGVYTDEDGNITGVPPYVVSFELSYGYGETVVGGMVEPDRFVMGSTDGENWFVLEKKLGGKKIQMIDRQDAAQNISDKITENVIQELASITGETVKYDEVSRYLQSKLIAYLDTRFLKGDARERIDAEQDNGRKKALTREALKDIAEELAAEIKEGKTRDVVKSYIEARFSVKTEGSTGAGIPEKTVNSLVDSLYKEVEDARRESRRGEERLKAFVERNQPGEDKDSISAALISAFRTVWAGKDPSDSDMGRSLRLLGMRENDQVSFRNLAYIVRSIIDNSFTTLVVTSGNHRNRYTLPDSQLSEIARMINKISRYYRDDRDVEFAIERDREGNMRASTVGIGGRMEKNTRLALYNVQARPYTAGVRDIDLVIERREVDADFLKTAGLKPYATGTRGSNASVGMVFRVDPNKDVGEQAAEIKRIENGNLTQEEQEALRSIGIDPSPFVSQGGVSPEKRLNVVLFLDEADPSHDPLMRLCSAVITKKGGETSHAAIFCREQGIPGIAGIGDKDLEHNSFVAADANNGAVYKIKAGDAWIAYYTRHGKFPLKNVRFKFKPYLVPVEKGDPKIGYIMAAETTAQDASPSNLALDAAGISLARAEFKGEEIGINVIAGYGYDIIGKIEQGKLDRDALTPFQEGIVEKLEGHPWIIQAIRKKLGEEGYSNFAGYVRDRYMYFYNNLGLSLGEDLTSKNRAYDFAQDKVQGLIGSELFSWPGHNPLVGLRGTSLEIKGVENGRGGYQDVLRFIFESVIKSNKNTHNQGWFYVFVRTPRELKILADVVIETAKEEGALPKEIGIMIEVPSNALYASEFAGILLNLKERCSSMGVPFDKVFFSFGTNDYTHLAGMGDRDDPRMKLKIMDPAARKAVEDIKQKGYFYAGEVDEQGYLPLMDEGSDVMLRLIGEVVKTAKRMGIDTSLCGEAITQLLARGNIAAAGRIMRLLDSFGISMVTARLFASMVKYDVMRAGEKLAAGGAGNVLFRLTNKKMDRGVIQGEVVFVEKPEDLISDELKGLSGEALEKRIEYLKYNDPGKLSRAGDKVVVISKRFNTSVEEMERLGIPWDDLQYARAILIDDSVDTEGWDIFSPERGIAEKRIKASVRGIGKKRNEIEGESVTIDFESGNVYQGTLRVEKIPAEIKGIDVPAGEPNPAIEEAVREDANGVYEKLEFNPLALMYYKNDSMSALRDRLKKILKERLEEVEKIQGEENAEEREWRLERYKSEIRNAYETEPEVRDFLLGKLKGENAGENIETFADRYIGILTAEIGDAVREAGGVEGFIKEAFKRHMLSVLGSVDNNAPVIHTMTSLNPKQFAAMRGGFLTEIVNPNPDYGLLGAARAVSDYWKINRLELEAFKEVRKTHKNFQLEISPLKGTQSGAVLMLMMTVLRDMGLVPGEDGLKVGVVVTTPSDTLSVGRYIDEAGINFVRIDKRRLGGTWLGADIDWDEEELVTEGEIRDAGSRAERIVKKALEEKGVPVVKFISADTYNSAAAESHILPAYLLGKVRERLPGYSDSGMLSVAYVDGWGNAHYDRGAVEVMGDVLNTALSWGIDTSAQDGRSAVIARTMDVLEAHERIEGIIKKHNIDLSAMEERVIRYLDTAGNMDEWPEGFRRFMEGAAAGEERFRRLLRGFLNNYPLYRGNGEADLSDSDVQLKLFKELVVHTIIEGRFFGKDGRMQGVRLLPDDYTDARKDRIELPLGLDTMLREGYRDAVTRAAARVLSEKIPSFAAALSSIYGSANTKFLHANRTAWRGESLRKEINKMGVYLADMRRWQGEYLTAEEMEILLDNTNAVLRYVELMYGMPGMPPDDITTFISAVYEAVSTAEVLDTAEKMARRSGTELSGSVYDLGSFNGRYFPLLQARFKTVRGIEKEEMFIPDDWSIRPNVERGDFFESFNPGNRQFNAITLFNPQFSEGVLRTDSVCSSMKGLFGNIMRSLAPGGIFIMRKRTGKYAGKAFPVPANVLEVLGFKKDVHTVYGFSTNLPPDKEPVGEISMRKYGERGRIRIKKYVDSEEYIWTADKDALGRLVKLLGVMQAIVQKGIVREPERLKKRMEMEAGKIAAGEYAREDILPGTVVWEVNAGLGGARDARPKNYTLYNNMQNRIRRLEGILNNIPRELFAGVDRIQVVTTVPEDGSLIPHSRVKEGEDGDKILLIDENMLKTAGDDTLQFMVSAELKKAVLLLLEPQDVRMREAVWHAIVREDAGSKGMPAGLPADYSAIKNAEEGTTGREAEELRIRFGAVMDVFKEVSGIMRKQEGEAEEIDLRSLIEKFGMLSRLMPVNELEFADSMGRGNKYIRLDIDELEGRPALCRWIEHVLEDTAQSPFIFYSGSGRDTAEFLREHPNMKQAEGVSMTTLNTVTLVDPSKVTENMPQDTLYMPAPYAVSTVYLAGEVIKGGGVLSSIKNPLMANTIRALYKTLAGDDISDADIQKWFRSPGLMLGRIENLSSRLDAVREAIISTETSA